MNSATGLLAAIVAVSGLGGCAVRHAVAAGHPGTAPLAGRPAGPATGSPGGTATGSPAGPATTPTASGAGLAVARTIPLAPALTTLFTAYGSSLYLVTVGAGQAATVIAVGRMSAGGACGGTASARIPFPLADFLGSITAGPDGLYLGTSVIRRLNGAGDVLVRLDPGSLAVAARASFAGSVRATAAGTGLWASIGDGTVVRLDPRELSVRASARLLPAGRAATGEAALSPPAYGLGSLWVLAGNEAALDLLRLDPRTLAVRSRTRVPTSGGSYQVFRRVLAAPDRVYLAGGSVQEVSAAGGLLGTPYGGGGLAGAALAGPDLVVAAADHTVRVLDRDFRTRAGVTLADGGGDLTAGGGVVWLSGDAGQGNGIVEIRLPA